MSEQDEKAKRIEERRKQLEARRLEISQRDEKILSSSIEKPLMKTKIEDLSIFPDCPVCGLMMKVWGEVPFQRTKDFLDTGWVCTSCPPILIEKQWMNVFTAQMETKMVECRPARITQNGEDFFVLGKFKGTAEEVRRRYRLQAFE